MDDLLNILTTFKSVNVAERVYFELKQMLFNYQIVPGQKLQCQDLAEKCKVSRTPVKYALNILEKEGYVELRHNKGYYVVEISFKEAEELFDIREAIETVAVRKAIENLNEDSLKLLKQTMKAYSEDVNKRMLSRKRLILDADFHLKIAEISGNRSLVETLRMIFSKIYLKHKIENLPPQRSKMADHEHKELYKAICSKDLSGALKKIRKHITLGRKNILGSLVEKKDLGQRNTN
jgi:DNA-binding GntR family transcriptional regulator